MVSGIELAGVVLATLPLCVEAAKAYSRGVDVIANVILKARRDEALSEFYEEFYWNISELSQSLRVVWERAIGDLAQPLSVLDLNQLKGSSADIADALKAYCGSETTYHQFLLITERLGQLLTELLETQSTYVMKRDLNETEMYNKLFKFTQHRESNETKSSFMERFHFFRKKDDRLRCLHKTKKWNKRLLIVIERAPQDYSRSSRRSVGLQANRAQPWNALVLSVKDPSAQIRVLTRDLYTVLSDCWRCGCTDIHEARFCLNLHNSEKSISDAAAEFDFMVSSWSTNDGTKCWQEGSVGIRTASSPMSPDTGQLRQVCGALRACMAAFRLRLLMEEIQGRHRLWKLDPKPRRLSMGVSEAPVSLQKLLSKNVKMGPKEKRELAVICAYSLLLLHGTPWLSCGWDKTNLSFFYKLTGDEPDFTRPFISTRFEQHARQISQSGLTVFHRNSHILALGILMIEVLNEKPIECWRTGAEIESVSPETEATINWLVADRIIKKMDNSPSKTAISACLNLDWIPQGRRVELEDTDVRDGLYKHVIQPLEVEIGMVE
ncbi:hypothetical protein EJ04DRAFT_581990 [Polyplosphaeria fusca]|uniref:DUF7580 domain-containing protein n=1 Tax=Polyplosphaeria fusca TaxID=682080 RepID=A0A9P4UT72_9PLEO|nr:hypothetical protein EJ04DRAFT_581990 [Polyplosphaeria fusca]